LLNSLELAHFWLGNVGSEVRQKEERLEFGVSHLSRRRPRPSLRRHPGKGSEGDTRKKTESKKGE